MAVGRGFKLGVL